jgi:hypothetical protein
MQIEVIVYHLLEDRRIFPLNFREKEKELFSVLKKASPNQEERDENPAYVFCHRAGVDTRSS